MDVTALKFDQCNSHLGCTGLLNCCPTPLGYRCIPPRISCTVKPGKCSHLSETQEVGKKTLNCTCDDDCLNEDKCCLIGKQKRCIKPPQLKKGANSTLSSTKHPGSGLLNLSGWKLFYSGADITTGAQAGVAEGWLHQAKALTLVQFYASNLKGEYEIFVKRNLLSEVANTESLILMGDFDAHVGADSETWKVEIGKNGPNDFNNNDMKLLRFYANRFCHPHTEKKDFLRR
ncbi:unnamed protein product [Soboliphyme baturini]|uniref:WAP domain-containing protein n=1 Tax=Soboliphyme baturini TaxID=241478 RepID=A0A183IZL2_9BILA|nr:unnamed protein product [Soboliphyme baturini]